MSKQTKAERLAEELKEAIIAGKWQPGEAMPTEPELMAQFEASRTVVRDATRMLAAQGLVDAQQGRGLFVTESPAVALADALLLALRRTGATVWDLEHFEQVVYPHVAELAAQQATEDDKLRIRWTAREYTRAFDHYISMYWDAGDQVPPEVGEELSTLFRQFIQSIFEATHNQVFALLAQPLLILRQARQWRETATTLAEYVERETTYVENLVTAVTSMSPEQAHKHVQKLMVLPPEAEEAMRQTPIGQVPLIDLTKR